MDKLTMDKKNLHERFISGFKFVMNHLNKDKSQAFIKQKVFYDGKDT